MIRTPAAPMKSANKQNTGHRPSDDEIATRAHQIFEERGGEHGRDLDDWLAAERELAKNGRK